MACVRGRDDSDALRKKGNELYGQIREGEGKLTAIVLRMRLTKAQHYYSEAARVATSQDQRASAFKNSACLCLLWAKFELRQFIAQQKEDQSRDPSENHGIDPLAACKRELASSVGFFAKAREEGLSAKKPVEWLRVLDKQLMELVKWASEEDLTGNFAALRTVCRSLDESTPPCEASFVAHMGFAERMFKQGVVYMNQSELFSSKDYKTCLRYMHECYRPLGQAESVFDRCQEISRGDRFKDLQDMRDQVQLYIRMCNSMQAINEGDDLIKRAVFDEVSLNMDLALLAIDKYLEAALLTREKDTETEAIAMSKLGKIYTDVLKMPTKAHKYNFQAITLALTIMSPRIARSDWYVYSSGKVKQHQDNRMLEENKEKDEANKAILLKLSDKIKKLKDKSNDLSAESFLEFLYKEHPHPNPEYFMGSTTERKETKEALQKAILHYHPDTNIRYGQEWCVLCNEITKFLNNKYENYK